MRRLFNLLAVVSLLLSFGLVFMWGRSSGVSDQAFYLVNRGSVERGTATVYGVVSRDGSAGPWVRSGPRDPWPEPAHIWSWQVGDRDNPIFPAIGRFGFSAGGSGGADKSYFVMAPYWFLAWLATWAPVVAAVRLFRSRYRLRKGLCGACGYDLRGSAGRCPECGAMHTELEASHGS